MSIALGKAKVALGLLPLVATLAGTPQRTSPILRIRVSQETSPGAGDFDRNVLGFVTALQSDGGAADFYMYRNQGPNYGNSVPVLHRRTSHIFFVNAADGLALFVVHNTSNDTDNCSPVCGNGGRTAEAAHAEVRFELSGGTASILKEDDEDETDPDTYGGTIFSASMDWAGSNTDGFVVGALPVGFTLLGQFLSPPRGLEGGWMVISGDSTTIPLQLVPGQRVRLDVHLDVDVRQDR